MSIVKDVNVNGITTKDTDSLLDYIIDRLKTGGGKYIAGLGFVTKDYLGEFQAVKVANQKTAGRQFRQITISPSPVGNNLSNDEYIEIGRRIAHYYYDKGYQVVVTLHLDTDTRHLHLMVNSVNYLTGKKFSQSKSDLNRLKLHCNRIFADYGLDQIRQSDDEMLEAVAHDLSEGFDCLELFDEIMADKANALMGMCDEPASSPAEHTVSESTYTGNSVITRHCFPIFRSPAAYSHTPFIPTEEVTTMNKKNTPSELPAAITEQLPEQFNATPRGLTIDCRKNLNLCVPADCSSSEIADLFNKIEPIPQSERAFNGKLGVAATAELKSRGFDTPVYVDCSTNVNIVFEDIMKSSIIDIDSEDDD